MSDENQLQEINRKLDLVTKLLTGNGDPSTGYIVRIDRLEQRDKRRDKWQWIVVGAVTVLIVTEVAGRAGFIS